jgi:hypothetical protein
VAATVRLDVDLQFSMDAPDDEEPLTGSITAAGADICVTLSNPARVMHGRRVRFAAIRNLAAALADLNATLEVTGPQGTIVRIGAVRTSPLLQLLTRSPHIELGDRAAYVPVLRSLRASSVEPSMALPPATLFPLVPTLNRRIRHRVTTTHYSPGSGRPRLIFVVGSENWNGEPPREFNLLPDVTTIGSGENSSLRLDGLAMVAAEIRHDEQDEYLLFLPGDTVGRVLRTGARIEVGPWRMAFFREEFADHGRPFGGRQGGELEHQKRQARRQR